jgi:hypothetical protein
MTRVADLMTNEDDKRMSRSSYEVTADSLQAARDQARARLPSGSYLLSERVLCDGNPVTVRETTENSASAFAAARGRVPAGAHIVDEKEVRAPENVTLRLAAENEVSAREEAANKLSQESVLQDISLITPGKKGFLGIGRAPSKYEIHILEKAIIEITYKADAKIVVTVGDEIASWNELLSAMTSDAIKGDPLSGSDLLSEFGYQIRFVLLTGKAADPSYFETIPFSRIEQSTVEKARGYVDHPQVPGLAAAFGAGLDPDRYLVQSGGDPRAISIARKANPQIDVLFVEAADCLRGRGTFGIADPSGLGTAAYDAICHYKDIPVVYFFCALPYLESTIYSGKLSPVDGLITAYKGIEGLFLEMWDEIGEGEVITDSAMTAKVRQLLAPGERSDSTGAHPRVLLDRRPFSRGGVPRLVIVAWSARRASLITLGQL